MPIQEQKIPTVVMINDLDLKSIGISTSLIYTDTMSSGVVSVFDDFSFYEADFLGAKNILSSLNTRNTNNSWSDTVGLMETKVTNKSVEKINVDLLIAFINYYTYSIDTEWFLNSFVKQVLNDTENEFRINIGVVPYFSNTKVDLRISGAKYYNYLSDIYCVASGQPTIICTDIVQGSGRLVSLFSDIYSCVEYEQNLNTDIFCSEIATSYVITSELNTVSGSLTYLSNDVFSVGLAISNTTKVDLKTRSLFVGDFFIERDRFTTASSIAWVDLIDYLYPINIDNTYLYVNDVLASGIYFEDIPNGKRMLYDPFDDFYSDGVLDYLVRVESIVGEVEEKTFYLLYGYDLQLNEVVNWGPNERILVRAEAQNLVFCPGLSGAAFDFGTVDLTSFNLGCVITAISYEDLPVSISPQSTVFFYGKTYTVKLQNVKDFSGNIMPDLEYTFTIEDPTNR